MKNKSIVAIIFLFILIFNCKQSSSDNKNDYSQYPGSTTTETAAVQNSSTENSSTVTENSDQYLTANLLLGDVIVTTKSASRVPVKNEKIFIDDKITTKDKSAAELITSNGSIIKIFENTSIEVKSIFKTIGGSTELVINSGKVNFIVKKLAKDSQFKVKTPTLIASVRGTVFSMNNAGGASKLSVISGKVAVSPAKNGVALPGEPKLIGANQTVALNDNDAAINTPNLVPQEMDDTEKNNLLKEFTLMMPNINNQINDDENDENDENDQKEPEKQEDPVNNQEQPQEPEKSSDPSTKTEDKPVVPAVVDSKSSIKLENLIGVWRVTSMVDEKVKSRIYKFPEKDLWMDLNKDGKGDIKPTAHQLYFRFSAEKMERISVFKSPIQTSPEFLSLSKGLSNDDFAGEWIKETQSLSFNENEQTITIGSDTYKISPPEPNGSIKLGKNNVWMIQIIQSPLNLDAAKTPVWQQ